MGKAYGYARVSTREQNELRQLVALHEMGITKKDLFLDKQSGKDFNRPMYKKLVARLREGDLIYVKSIDRLGRNYQDIIEQWKLITQNKRADIVVLDMPLLDTRRGKDLMGTFLTDVVLALLSYVAENERTNIVTRQAEGIAAAKAKGVKFGAPVKEIPEKFEEARRLWMERQMTLREAALLCGMPKSTFYEKARKLT
ncbi:MAG: recombinase family protein [Lachnospiraceae bacterium]|jgi:DNA invertase Pin-like site-specific DNA recombinase|nr:recombinase family protein [Lachnospiraceae bacterium]